MDLLTSVASTIRFGISEFITGVYLACLEYQRFIRQVAFNEELDFATKFLTVAIQVLLVAEFAYLFMPHKARKWI